MSRSSPSARVKAPVRFQPSRRDVDFYRALTASNRPLSIIDLMQITGAERSTVDHSLRWYFQHGLVNRVFLGKSAWFSWAPNKAGAEMAKAMADAASIADAVPEKPKVPAPAAPEKAATTNPAAQALRGIAALLNAAADQLEQARQP